MNATAKQQLRRNVANDPYSNPTKTYSVPAVTNEDGTLSLPAQPVYGIDPNHEPIDGYMAVRSVPGGTINMVRTATTLAAGGAGVGTVPVGKRWAVYSMIADVTASATVGNRLIYARVYNPAGNIVWAGPTSTATAAAQVLGYDVAFGNVVAPNTTVRRNLANTANTNVQVTCASPIAQFPAGAYIQLFDTAAIDVADAVVACTTYVEYDV